MKYLVQSHTKFLNVAKQEILDQYNLASFENLFDGNFIANLDLDFKEAKKIANKAIFISNIYPIHFTTKETDLKNIIKFLTKKVRVKLDKKKTFRIETLTYDSEIQSRDIEVKLGQGLEKLGYKPNLEKGEIVIFIVSDSDNYFVSILNRKDTIYPHIDLAKRFSRRPRLNRAQFKLVEALERFNLKLSGKTALDIGAAPGGWTKVLADKGYTVYAIDPAELDDSLKDNPKIIHIKKKIEDSNFNKKVDLIVNDMNISPEESAKITNNSAKYLKKGSYAIFSLKLIENKPKEYIQKVSKIFTKYKIEKIKHLFENRQEVTILLRKLN